MAIPNEFEAIRGRLLKSYDSRTITHGGYIIALMVGFLTLVSRWEAFAETIFLLYFLFSLVISLGVYLVSRIIFWSLLAYGTLFVTENEVRAPEIEGNTVIGRMQNTVLRRARTSNLRHHRFALFCNDNKILLLIIVFAIAFMGCLVLHCYLYV